MAFKGSSLYTLLQMVAGNMGITFLPEMANRQVLIGDGEVSLIPLDESGPHREIGMSWRLSSPRQNDYRLLCSKMEEILKNKVIL
ncbi:MAG: hypothetical protein HQL68_00500 [Magnetococcales bacterium]|nr:hypothetical protein [Magnetococcales bacterium]